MSNRNKRIRSIYCLFVCYVEYIESNRISDIIFPIIEYVGPSLVKQVIISSLFFCLIIEDKRSSKSISI